MNQFNQFVQQMRSLFEGMTPQSKLMAILLVIGIGVSSVFLIQGSVTGNGTMVYLLDGKPLSEEALDKIEFALGNSGLRGFERIGNRIRVPKASSDVYYKAISEGKAIPDGMGNAVEKALNSGSMLDNTQTTQAKLLSGKLKDLSDAIKRMDPMIYDAYITYSEDRIGFASNRIKTASVAIQTKGSKELSGDRRRAIISFVEKSFAGLKQSDIALYCNGETMIASDDPISMQQSKYYQLKRQQEQEYRIRAEKLLTDYGNVRLDVNVELDPMASEETETLSFNEKPTKIQSATSKKDAKSQRMQPGGRPGTDPNVVSNKGQSLSSPDQNMESKEQFESEKSVTGNTLTKKETVGHQTTQVSVSVSIPFSYYRKAATYKWRELNPTKKASEMPEMTPADLELIQKETERSIQGKINPLLPKVAAGEDKLPRVTVDSYTDFPVQDPPEASLATTSMVWLSQSWQTLVLIGLVLAALLSLRSFAKTIPASNDRDFERGFDLPLDDAVDIDLSSLTDEENDAFDPQAEGGETAPPRLRTTGGDIKNDLTAMVRENPDAAATMLRNWITDSM